MDDENYRFPPEIEAALERLLQGPPIDAIRGYGIDDQMIIDLSEELLEYGRFLAGDIDDEDFEVVFQNLAVQVGILFGLELATERAITRRR